MGGLDNYVFGNKNVWRRWAWNRVEYYAKAIGKKPKDMFGIYLIGGANDLDIATKKGFKKENLFGIDIDKKSIKKAKEKKGITINARVQDVIIDWKKEPFFDFVLLDFCCGLTRQIRELIINCIHCKAINSNTLFLINLERGRDKPIHELLEFENDETQKNHNNLVKAYKVQGDYKKHRGIQFAQFLSYAFFCLYEKDPGWFKFLDIYNYKSVVNGATLLFDSVCLKWPIDNFVSSEKINNIDIFNKISAAKSIRTMRMAA